VSVDETLFPFSKFRHFRAEAAILPGKPCYTVVLRPELTGGGMFSRGFNPLAVTPQPFSVSITL
jgi:hypothetical protein